MILILGKMVSSKQNKSGTVIGWSWQWVFVFWNWGNWSNIISIWTGWFLLSCDCSLLFSQDLSAIKWFEMHTKVYFSVIELNLVVISFSGRRTFIVETDCNISLWSNVLGIVISVGILIEIFFWSWAYLSLYHRFSWEVWIWEPTFTWTFTWENWQDLHERPWRTWGGGSCCFWGHR